MWRRPGTVQTISTSGASGQAGSPIVAPEPILYLDAVDYTGSGTTWPAEVGSDGTLINAPSYTAPSPTYFSFNGTDEAATTANLKASFGSSNSQTLEIWVRTTSDNGVVISQQGSSPINSGYHFSAMEIVAGDLKIGLWEETGGIGDIVSTTVGAVTRNEWQQYVLTYDDVTNTLTGYINAATPASTTLENFPPSPQWYYALCQADPTSMGDGGYLAADVGLFRVYNQALTAVQVQDLYNENLARFSLTPTVTSFTTAETTTWSAPAGVSRVQYLVVSGAGGGATGYDRGGGGGGAAGMALTGTTTVTPGTTYTVIVGNGGTGGADERVNNPGASGENSVFATVTALGGIGGQGSRTFSPTARFTGGAAQIGSGTSALSGGGGGGGGSAGGGGGATGAGNNGAGTAGGAGGAGLTSSITGSSVTYAAGGAGGGYDTDIDGANGTTNRGNGGAGGGAASGSSAKGGNGGSGIVVIKYGQ